MDDFMSLVIPVSQEQLRHVANAIMHGIHDVFPPDNDDNEDPISEKKMKKGEGLCDIKKHSCGLISTAMQRPCGWNRQSKRSCRQFLKDGYVHANKDPWESCSVSTNQPF